MYRKHCLVCHPDPSRLSSRGDIVSFIKAPTPSMPAFGEDKVSDRDVRAIADFIRHGALDFGKAPQPEVASNVPVIDTPASVTIEPEKQLKAGKPAKDKKSQVRSFVKKWSIKGIRNGEVETVQTFDITSNKNHELAVVPLTKLADYTVKVTAFEIIDKTLKLQFTWTWKNAPSYWKIETFELTLSNDGKKLSGSYNLRADSTNMSRKVWGE